MADILSTPGDVFALIYRSAPGYAAHLSLEGALALSGDAGDYWFNTAVVHDSSGAEATLRRAATVLRDRGAPR